eukprot:TRINITY_DN300_c0_g1_i1.p1 TRINITY_DN300_c0_g1~~TRINITY_DN300_c0_g1_i1.p1  ORF type:complete len:341 (-),score=43.64 TRINITY_DN300_c0_g1_i1:38-1060(-)
MAWRQVSFLVRTPLRLAQLAPVQACGFRAGLSRYQFNTTRSSSSSSSSPFPASHETSQPLHSSSDEGGGGTTHFGFTDVDESAKQGMVYDVFHRVAAQYDVMNDVMSGGMHRYWKNYFIQKLGVTQDMKLLDVAGGTGDIAFRFLGSADREGVSGATVTLCDINKAMLGEGKRRTLQNPALKGDRLQWVNADAESLPIRSNSVDAYTIAFGIRNCTHIDKVLREAYRVLKPGGRFMCLEFSHVRADILREAYNQYSFTAIPKMGEIIANDRASYQYLVESIRKFPDQETFCDMIADAGFHLVDSEDLTGGIVAIHSGFKLGDSSTTPDSDHYDAPAPQVS